MQLPDSTIEQVYQDCVDKYPNEACGFIRENMSVNICNNIQADLKEKEPSRFERDPSNGYSFSPEDIKALNNSLQNDNPAIVIYHSHPNYEAYFSEETSYIFRLVSWKK